MISDGRERKMETQCMSGIPVQPESGCGRKVRPFQHCAGMSEYINKHLAAGRRMTFQSFMFGLRWSFDAGYARMVFLAA